MYDLLCMCVKQRHSKQRTFLDINTHYNCYRGCDVMIWRNLLMPICSVDVFFFFKYIFCGSGVDHSAVSSYTTGSMAEYLMCDFTNTDYKLYTTSAAYFIALYCWRMSLIQLVPLFF